MKDAILHGKLVLNMNGHKRALIEKSDQGLICIYKSHFRILTDHLGTISIFKSIFPVIPCTCP